MVPQEPGASYLLYKSIIDKSPEAHNNPFGLFHLADDVVVGELAHLVSVVSHQC